jgi:UDP-GlcNAc:undecaprenyl-phosphate GlcNAc-1-phosphate transferase
VKIYLLLGIISFALTYLLTPLIRQFAIKTGAVSTVRARDIHSRPTPRLGGLAILISLLMGALVANQFNFLRPLFESDVIIIPVLIGAVLITVVGMLDDYFDLDWFLKLALQIGVAAFVSWQGVRILTLPIGGLLITSVRTSFVLTVIIIVAVMNAINFIDGLDGLSSGIVGIASLSFFGYCYLISQGTTSYASSASLLSIVLCGACAGFLPYNFYPARIFVGDSGALLMGYMMACSAIIVTGRISPDTTAIDSLPSFMPILLPFLVLIFPACDMFLSVIRRLIHKRSPFQADRQHVHHRMMMLGHSQRGTVILLYLWTLVIGFGSILMILFDPLWVMLGGALALITLLLVTFGPYLVHFLARFRT